MRNISKNISNEYPKVLKEPSSNMIHNTLLKLRYVLVIGVIMSISSCAGYTVNLNESGSEMPIYPVIQF